MYGLDMYGALYGYALAYTASSEKYGEENALGAYFCLIGDHCEAPNGYTLGHLEQIYDELGIECEINDGFIVGYA